MTDPKLVLKRLASVQLQEIIASTLNFEKMEKKLTSSYGSYWRSLRQLATAVME
jgi:hypothetical protein